MVKIIIRKEECVDYNDGYVYYFVGRDGVEIEIPNLKQKKDKDGIDLYTLSLGKFLNLKNYPEVGNEDDFKRYPKYLSTKRVEEIGINEIELIEKEIKNRGGRKNPVDKDKQIVDSMNVEESKEYNLLLKQSKEILDKMSEIKNKVKERLEKERLKKTLEIFINNNIGLDEIQNMFKEIKGE